MAPPPKSPTSRQAPAQQAHPCSYLILTSGFCGLIFVLAGILSGVVVPLYIQSELAETVLVCDKASTGYAGFQSTRHANTKTYELNLLYNITNAYDYLTSNTSATIIESQPYIFQKKSKRFDVEFGHTDSEGYDTVKYKSWDQYTFIPEMSCDGCTINDEFYTMSIPYSGILTAGLSEATIILATSCTSKQIENIVFSAGPYCNATQMGKEDQEGCVCCEPGVTCDALLNPQLSAGSALFSYLGQADRGVKVLDEITKLGVSGVYSSVIVLKSVREILLGYASALAGYGVVSTATDSAAYTVSMAAQFTSDYATVCQHICTDTIAYETYALTTGASNPLNRFAVLQTTCNTRIPDTNEELADTMGLSEDDVEQYSYLRSMSCSAFPWASFGKLMAGVATGAECAAGTDGVALTPGTDYCCLWSGSTALLSDAPMQGFGCVGEVGGGLNERMTDTEQEARTFTAGTDLYVREIRTGCGAQMNRRQLKDRETQTMVTYKDRSINPVWSSLLISGNKNATQLDVTSLDPSNAVNLTLSGAYGTATYPKGLSAPYFSADVSDGKPLNNRFKVFPVTTRRGLDFVFDKTIQVKGVNAARFVFDVSQLAATPENQHYGQARPYKGLIAGYFYYASSTFIHCPEFAYGNHYLLTQNDNTAHESTDTTGITIYQTVEDYMTYAPRAPRALDDAALTGYEEDGSLLAYAAVEPASGNFIEGHNRIGTSLSVWECDVTSFFMGFCKYAKGRGSCYSDSMGAPYPCSAANVFTPNMHGGKIIPIAFNDEYASIAHQDADAFIQAGEIVMYARIVMILLCAIGLAIWGATSYVSYQRSQTYGVSKRKSVEVSVPAELAKIYGTDDKSEL